MAAEFNPADFAIPNVNIPTTKPKPPTCRPTMPRRREFIKSVDVAWLAEAFNAGLVASRVAAAIAFRHGLDNELVVRPKQHDYKRFGVTRAIRCRGIKTLETAGLIRKLNSGSNELPKVEIVLPPQCDTTDE